MAENLALSLQQYEAHLQQVVGALINEPENEDLLKLQLDLQSVVELTKQLLQQSNSASDVGKTGDVAGGTNTSTLPPFPGSSADPSDNLRSKKQQANPTKVREYHKLRSQKRNQRSKQLDQEREAVKTSWQQFNTKGLKKNKKGHVKKSIFGTTDYANGRVGVGTCGISGRPMTEYQQQEKRHKSSKS